MKIHSISFSSYKLLKDQIVIFNSDSTFPFGAQIIAVIGANGCGKTTLCSLIARAFESFCSLTKAPFDYEIMYSQNGIKYSAKQYGNRITITSDGASKHTIDISKKNKLTHKAFIEKTWKGRIILSTFESSGEYQTAKPHNFIGVSPTVKYDAKHLYGKNMFEYPPISGGILNFITDPRLHKLAKQALRDMGLFYEGYVEIKIRQPIIDLIQSPRSTNPISKMRDLSYEPEDDIKFAHYVKSHKDVIATADNQIITTSTLISMMFDVPSSLHKHFYINGIVFAKKGKLLTFDSLSLGEKFFLARYFSIAASIREESLIIIEEPENHLNPSWREIFIPIIHKLASAYNSCVIFTSHDFRTVRYLHNSNVMTLNNGIAKPVDAPTLLCDEFDFENLGGNYKSIVYKEVESALGRMSNPERIKLINSICRVPEKFKAISEHHRLLEHEKNIN